MNSRIQSGTPAVSLPERKSPEELKAETPVPVQPMVRVNSTEELKNAELRGEEYSISEEQLVKAIEQAIKKIEGRTTSLSFSVHEQTKRIMVKVLDKQSGEVIREVPPEKNLDFLASLWQMAGILIDEKR